MAEAVYLGCGLTSVLCALLLARAFFQTRTALLFWSATGFTGLAASNIVMFVDLVVVPQTDLSLLRAAISAISMTALAGGLVWSARER